MSTNILSPFYPEKTDIERIVDGSVIADSFQNFLSDESKLKGEVPLSLSFPKSVEELSTILQENYSKHEATTFSGARSGVVGGAVPFGQTHLVSMSKLKGVIEVYQDNNSKDFFVTAYSGTPLSEINSYLEDHHPELFYPVDPTYQDGAIGGNVSTNAGGARSFFYGPTRKWVYGLTVVLADGAVLELSRDQIQAKSGKLILHARDGERTLNGAEIKVPKTKHAIGYHFNDSVDVVDMLVGAEGTLAAIAKVRLKLTTKPKHRLYFTQFFTSIETAFEFAQTVKKLGLKILALEFVDDNSLKLVSDCAAKKNCKTIQSIKPEYSAAVFLDLTYDQEDELDLIHSKLESLLSSLHVSLDNSIAGTESKDLKDFKVFRHAIPENINAIVAERKNRIPALHKISTDMSVNPERLKEVFDFYNETLRAMDIDFFVFGHFGDAHLHLNVIPKSLEQLEEFKTVYPAFARKVVECGGAVAGEHGIGRVKKDFLTIQYSSKELQTLKQIKSFFDPEWLLNPGVLLDR